MCIECKQRGTVCVMVQGTPCFGPVTHAGCGAICRFFRRGCYGCYGPMETPNTAALARERQALGATPRDIAPSTQRPKPPGGRARSMATETRATKTIRVDYLARVEGEGAPDLEISEGRMASAARRIFVEHSPQNEENEMRSLPVVGNDSSVIFYAPNS